MGESGVIYLVAKEPSIKNAHVIFTDKEKALEEMRLQNRFCDHSNRDRRPYRVFSLNYTVGEEVL